MRTQIGIGIGTLTLLLVSNAAATEYHVAPTGLDMNAGTSAAPWLTLHKAAQTLKPGDICTVHAGTYREQLDPTQSGASEAARIVYRAAEGEHVSIRGSEQIKTWTADGSAWKVVVPNTLFGAFNPYSDKISGSYLSYGGDYHLGEVYLDGAAYSEVLTKGEVSATASTWYAEVDASNTTIWANFGAQNPNDALAEINVRKYVVSPTASGVKYITIEGFDIAHGSPDWAPPDAPQEGMISLNWGLSWVIQNNHISDGKTVCICGGVVASGGSEEIDEVGNHVIRHNTIERCGEAGIAGSHGMVASVIDGNLIQEINPQRHFGGYESAGIKIHTAVDVVIENNIIRRVHANPNVGASHPGIWLDWQSQGSRISGNLIYDIDQSILELEMDHGPTLVDNNIFVGSDNWDDSENSIFVHNLLINHGWSSAASDGRSSSYFKPHTTNQAGSQTHASADNRYFNNIHVDRGTDGISEAPGYQCDYNVFYGQAHKSSWADAHSVTAASVDAAFAVTSLPNGATISVTADTAPRDVMAPLITRDFIGLGTLTQQGIENHDGTPITIDKDMTGAARDGTHPTAGPLEQLKAGVNTFTITRGATEQSVSGGASASSSGATGSSATTSDAATTSNGAGGSANPNGAGGSGATSNDDDATSDESGCGCRVAGAPSSSSEAIVLLGLALSALMRRRSRADTNSSE